MGVTRCFEPATDSSGLLTIFAERLKLMIGVSKGCLRRLVPQRCSYLGQRLAAHD